ncbi:MAG TPA: helix-turn-helix domain-containing protein [Saprospiraceae bacterium]|nr:helix-turn-helix domain-containing protein [Saprospiraceae bacterium]MCB9271538.1 helix-turn-helix domain-containing protein [Lewinellaceae bacterium]HPG08415.1 helix-turn-helix domain-containing protein [Saprospiraceae bacterium]HRV87499.1 helix-turn-helix domain-containing protein [Saprospiraceae bacterium]
MRLKPIRTEEDYDKALARLEDIFEAEPGTKEGDELEILAMLIEDYEDKHYPIGPPHPIEAIKFRMEQMGMKQQDLAKILGHKSRASEILNKKRKLTLEMIRKLNKELKIPTEVLVQEY